MARRSFTLIRGPFPSGTAVLAYTARTGGARVTDLLDVDGNATAILRPSALDGALVFSGPDGGTETLYLQDTVDRRRLRVDAEAPASPSTSVTYDAQGRVSSVTQDGATTTYTYNADGTIASHTRGGVTQTYSYDGSGRLTGVS